MNAPDLAPQGSTEHAFAAVREAFAGNFRDGTDHGAAFAVVKGDRRLVDLWGGHADAARRRPWQRDTIVCVQSVTKSLVALALAMLVDRGKLSYDMAVAEVWPAFAAGGKGAITLDQILSHQAGLNSVRERLDLQDLYQGDRFIRALEAMEPLYPPGSQCIYHALSYGFLGAEILRRADGRGIGRFIAEEIAAPLDAAIYLGLPEAEEQRVAEIVPAPDADDPMEEASRRPSAFGYVNPRVRPTEPNTRAWRAAEMPAGGAHADALSLARLYAGLAADGGMGDGRLLSPAGLAAATAERFDGIEGGFGWPIRFGAGFMLNKDATFGPSPRAFGHSGWGGYLAYADPDAGIGVAYVTNRMATFGGRVDPRRTRLLEALYRAL